MCVIMAEETVDSDVVAGEESYVHTIFKEIFTSPLNLFLIAVCAVLVKIVRSSDGSVSGPVKSEPSVPKLKKQDMTLEQLRKYNGTGEYDRLCVCVNGSIFDVTRGKKFYGPGGPYAAFAGRDATRALATFSVNDVKDEYDDLSDLSSLQMESVREWQEQFREKYDYIGKLLRPGEQAAEYSDEDDAKESKDKEGKSKKE